MTKDDKPIDYMVIDDTEAYNNRQQARITVGSIIAERDALKQRVSELENKLAIAVEALNKTMKHLESYHISSNEALYRIRRDTEDAITKIQGADGETTND